MEKQYSDVFESLNPAIVTLLLRRPTGIQALECHVFITRSINEGKTIVDRIHEVCNLYKSNLNQKANLFQYKPYTEFLIPNKEISSPVNNKLTSSSRIKFSETNHSEKHKRSKSLANVSPQTSVFSKIKANLKDKSNFMKKQDKNEVISKLERNLNRSSIKSAPDQKSYQQSELSMMVKTRPISVYNNKNENTAIKSSNSISLNNQKEKKISFPKRFFLSARASIKSTRSSIASPSKKSFDSSKKNAKYASTSSLADIDFRDTKSIFNRNLLIDGSFPSLPGSRSGSPISIRQRPVNFDQLKRPSSSMSDKTNQNKANKLYVKNTKSQQFSLKDVSRNQNNHSYASSLSEKQDKFNKFDLSKPIMSQSFVSKDPNRNSIIDLSDDSEIKTPKTNPEMLSNHLVWNPRKRAPESLDKIISSQSPVLISSENRKIDAYMKKNYNEWIKNNENRNTNSPFLSTTPVSELLETSSINKFKFKDSAYNTNSSNEENESNIMEAKNLSAFSFVKKQNTDHLQKKDLENFYFNNSVNNEDASISKANHKIVTNGVKVFPTFSNNRFKQTQNEVPHYPRRINEEKFQNSDIFEKKQERTNTELIDLTQFNQKQIDCNNENSFISDKSYHLKFVRYKETESKRGNLQNFNYHFNNDNFGGY